MSPTCRVSQAINLLPANVQIKEIQVFLESVLEEKAQRKRCNQVVKSLLQAEFLRVSCARPPGPFQSFLCVSSLQDRIFQEFLEATIPAD